MIKVLDELLKYRFFLSELVKRDFKKKYYKSVLGVLWTILNPLLMMAVIAFIFSTLFKRSVSYFPVYYLCGWTVFNFNSEATSTGLFSIVDNAALIRKIYIPSYLFCISKAVLAMVNKLFSLIPLLLVMLILKAPLHWTSLLLPLLLVPLFFFSLGLSLALASVAVYLRDTSHLYSIICMMWMYLSAIFYPVDIIPEKLRPLLNLNPLYHYICIMRDIVLYGTLPALATILYALSYSALAMGIGVTLYKALRKNFMLHI